MRGAESRTHHHDQNHDAQRWVVRWVGAGQGRRAAVRSTSLATACLSAPSWSTDEFQLAGFGAHRALQEPGRAWVQETVGRAAWPMAWRATLNPKHGEVPPDLAFSRAVE